jgi:type I restriction enzyme M protein
MHNSGLGKGSRQAELVRMLLCRTWLFRNPEVKVATQNGLDLQSKLRHVLNEVAKELPGLDVGDFELSGDALASVWENFWNSSDQLSNSTWAQDIFMKFGPQFLRKDLDQYFTPAQIVAFMCGVLDLKKGNQVIDPAGGSGDFLTGSATSLIERGKAKETLNLNYWDQSIEASEVARLNFWLHDAQPKIEVKDSIKFANDDEGAMDFCITNPPFGTKTIWEAPRPLEEISSYDLAHKWAKNQKTQEIFRQQLGILFIERGIRLLKQGGILAIVLPSGYMSNPSEAYLRRWLLQEHQVLGVISLPAGTFKKSGAGVTPDILFVKKGKNPKAYPIFMAQARSIGFDFKKQDTPPIYKLSEISGTVLTDEMGIPIPDNDLVEIAKEFSAFAFQNNIAGLVRSKAETGFESVSSSEVLSTAEAILSPKRYSREYLGLLKRFAKMDTFTLASVSAEVSNSSGFNKIIDQKYVYLDIGEIGRCSFGLTNEMRGWALPDRAKQKVDRGDILVSRLAGSANKFCLITSDAPNLVATNGLWKIRIADEETKLAVLLFMFSKDYQTQIEALATGSIMEDIKEQDFMEKVFFPKNPDPNALNNLREFLDVQSRFIHSAVS